MDMLPKSYVGGEATSVVGPETAGCAVLAVLLRLPIQARAPRSTILPVIMMIVGFIE
jgi:hypothetical protein